MSQFPPSPDTKPKPKRQRVLTRRQQQRRDESNLNNDEDVDETDQTLCCIGPRDDGMEDSSASALPPIPRHKFSYGDHTADIILHGYGSSPQECIETTTYAMLAYMFDHPERTTVNHILTHTITVFGQDIPDLIFRFLTEILAQGVNYWDDLSSDVKNRVRSANSEPNYPGMVPRVVRVVSLSEEDPSGLGAAAGRKGKHNDQNDQNDHNIQQHNNITLAADSTAGTLKDLDNNNNIDVQAAREGEADLIGEANNLNKTKEKGKIFKLVVEIQGDWLAVHKLGAGTEVKAITKELTMLQLLTDQAEIEKGGGKYHLQVLVDI